MRSQKLRKHSKETFVSPKVVVTLGIDLENELLVGSYGKAMTFEVESVGHEIGGKETIASDYWE